MTDLLRSDFYKLRKGKSFLVLCIVAVVFAAITVFSVYFLVKMVPEMAGSDVSGTIEWSSTATGMPKGVDFFASAFPGSNLIILFAILTALFIASEFAQGTIKGIVARGFSRTKLYFSKLIVSMTASTVILVLYLAASVGLATLLFGFGTLDGDGAASLLRMFFVELLLHLAWVSVLVTIAMIVRSTGGAISFGILLILFASLFVRLIDMMLSYFFKTTVDLSQFLLTTNISEQAALQPKDGSVLRAVIVGCAFLIAAVALGVEEFHRRDIK